MAGRMPMRRKASGLRNGNSTPSRSLVCTSLKPPTSSQVTFGTWIMISRRAEGCTRLRAFKKSSRQTWSASRISGGMPSLRLICGRTRRSASIAASRASAERSAPTKP